MLKESMRNLAQKTVQRLMVLLPWALATVVLTLESTGYGVVKQSIGALLSLSITILHAILFVNCVKRLRTHLHNRSLSELDQHVFGASLMFLLGSLCLWVIGYFLR